MIGRGGGGGANDVCFDFGDLCVDGFSVEIEGELAPADVLAFGEVDLDNGGGEADFDFDGGNLQRDIGGESLNCPDGLGRVCAGGAWSGLAGAG